MIGFIFSVIFNIIVWGGFISILFFPLICFLATYIMYGKEEYGKIVEENIKIKEEKIDAFCGTPTQSTYNNPSNITDDAFLLFIGEQKLAYGHPESIKSNGEEW